MNFLVLPLNSLHIAFGLLQRPLNLLFSSCGGFGGYEKGPVIDYED
jgi:hypothetical protein